MAAPPQQPSPCLTQEEQELRGRRTIRSTPRLTEPHLDSDSESATSLESGSRPMTVKASCWGTEGRSKDSWAFLLHHSYKCSAPTPQPTPAPSTWIDREPHRNSGCSECRCHQQQGKQLMKMVCHDLCHLTQAMCKSYTLIQG